MKTLIYRFLFLAAPLLSTIVQANPTTKIPLSGYSNEIILKWNTVAWETMLGPNYSTMIGSRVMAMVHLAMHDALNNISPTYETYALHAIDRKADPVVAMSVAAHTVLVASFPERKEQLDAALNDVLKNVKAGVARDRALVLGVKAGNTILELRAHDGAFADPIGTLNNPEVPGLYQVTPPLPFVYSPFWATMKPFGIAAPAQFRIPPMPALTSNEYADAFNEVKSKGAKDSSTRTAEETTIAKFWYEFSEIGWNRVTATVVKDTELNLVESARVFALVSMALADGYIAGWDSKLHHNFWRPYTAIRKASTDSNDKTTEDTTWEPLLGTPPIHDYPSTHSVLGSSAATVLMNIFGERSFTMTSTTAEPVGSTRTFPSFSEAARENGDSRVFAGIHFRFSCVRGLDQGKQIGEWMLTHHLKPKGKEKNPGNL